MFQEIVVIGVGRAGRPIAERLSEQFSVRVSGRELACANADLVLICTPDSVINEVARAIEIGPWVCHVSGATSLDALAPHTRRLSVHPLQTLHSDAGPTQFDGAFAALSADDTAGMAVASTLATALGLTPFELADDDRPLYHAGATVAASFLVTLQRAAADLVERAGAPREAVDPLIRRVVEHGFVPTGPHVRGDVDTINEHLVAITTQRPELEPLYRALCDATELLSAR